MRFPFHAVRVALLTSYPSGRVEGSILRARVTTSFLSILLVLAVGACTGRSISPALHVGPAKPLPRETHDGMPAVFVSVDQDCSNTSACSSALGLYSARDGGLVRRLASTPIVHGISTVVYPVGISSVSRAPTGDVWFVLTEPFCQSEIYRIDARTGHISLVVKRCGLRAGPQAESPDGRFLAYILASPDPCDSGSALVIRDLRSGSEREVLPLGSHGLPPRAPKPRLPEKPPPTFDPDYPYGHGEFPCAPHPTSPGFEGALVWSLDSRQVVVGHHDGSSRADCFGCEGPNDDLDLIDARTLRMVDEVHTSCGWVRSLAFDAGGLLAGLDYCKVGGGSEHDEMVVQYSDDLRAQLFRTALPKCAINSPDVASTGLHHDLLLVTSYYFCSKSAWSGKPPLHDVGPEYLVEVLANGQLHPLHVYAAPNGIRSPPVW